MSGEKTEQPSAKKVRKALRDQIPDLRIERNAAFVEAIGSGGSARIDAFLARLDPLGGVSPEAIREAATALTAGAGPVPKPAVDNDA